MWCSEQGTMSCCVERLSERLGSCNAKEETGFDSYTLALYSKSDNTGGWNRKPTIMRQDTQMIWRHTNIHDNIKMYTQSHSGIREYKALCHKRMFVGLVLHFSAEMEKDKGICVYVD